MSNFFNLGNGRFSDNDRSFLSALSNFFSNNNGKEWIWNHSETDFSSEGKYTRHIKTVYKIIGNKIEQTDTYKDDDDGQTGSSTTIYSTAREILNFAKKHHWFFKD